MNKKCIGINVKTDIVNIKQEQLCIDLESIILVAGKGVLYCIKTSLCVPIDQCT